MKIVNVIGSLAPRYGGPSQACRQMARALAQQGHQISIITTTIDGDADMDVPLDGPVVEKGVTIHYSPVGWPRWWVFSWPLAQRLQEEIPSADLVVIHSLYLFHCAAAGFLCRHHRVPYVIRPHGILDPFIYRRRRARKRVMELLFENANIKGAAALHFTAEEEKTLAAPFTFGAPSFVAPLGVTLADYDERVSRDELDNAWPELAGKRIVLALGRVNFKKGFDILAKAFAQVAANHDDLALVIAGPDNDGYADTVRAFLTQEKVIGKTLFTGMVTGRRKMALLNNAALFTLPSYSENFGVAVVEAMACRLPVVISDKVNIWREIDEAGAGRVTPCDGQLFGEAMRQILSSPDQARLMGEKGRALVKRRFVWDQIALHLEKTYQSIIEGNRANAR